MLIIGEQPAGIGSAGLEALVDEVRPIWSCCTTPPALLPADGSNC
jgi:hypothetical protein